MTNFKKITNVWSLVYKENNEVPKVYSYTSEKEAKLAKILVEDSNGEELIDEKDNVVGYFELEWCYLINGKLIS